MNLKRVALLGFVVVNLGLVNEDFTQPKHANSRLVGQVSAKKIRESILESVGAILKALLEKDRNSLDSREFFQDEFELSLCGDEQAFVDSSSKAKLQATLHLLQDLKRHLINDNQKFKELMTKIKNLKTGKLKG